MTTATHEKTIEQHVQANINVALESREEYARMEDLRDSFMQNTRDSIEADGYAAEEAFDAGNWFASIFAEITGVE